MVKDGEGATKMFEVRVEGASFPKDARRIAASVANSNLVKTAIAGASPNWGRIMAALGSAHTKIKPEKIAVFINNILVVKNGQSIGADMLKVRESLGSEKITILIKLNQGTCGTRFWGCDLTEEYIEINKKYV